MYFNGGQRLGRAVERIANLKVFKTISDCIASGEARFR